MSGVTYEIMKQRQALPLDSKVVFTEQRIRTWYSHWHGDVYVSFSGGKDSTVLVDIAKRMFPDIPAVFCDTGLEYPEVRELALRKADVVLKPTMNFKIHQRKRHRVCGMLWRNHRMRGRDAGYNAREENRLHVLHVRYPVRQGA